VLLPPRSPDQRQRLAPHDAETLDVEDGARARTAAALPPGGRSERRTPPPPLIAPSVPAGGAGGVGASVSTISATPRAGANTKLTLSGVQHDRGGQHASLAFDVAGHHASPTRPRR